MTKSALSPSAELGPIQTVALAGSTRSCISMFQKASSSRPTVNSTRFDSPGARATLRNPSSCLTGRATLVPRRRTYSSTTSSPARDPAFPTVVETQQRLCRLLVIALALPLLDAWPFASFGGHEDHWRTEKVAAISLTSSDVLMPAPAHLRSRTHFSFDLNPRRRRESATP